MTVPDETPLGSELLTRALLEASPDAVVIVDERGTVVALNEIAGELLGYDAGELVGRSVDDLVPSDARDRHRSARAAYDGRRRLLSGRPYLLATRKDGSTLDVQVSLTPIGSGETVAAVLRDVTERRRLAETSERWAHLFEHIELGVLIGSPDDTFELVNPAFERMHRTEPGALTGTPLFEVFAPELHAEVSDHLALVDADGNHVWESVHLRTDGTRFPVLVDATAVRSLDGHLLYRAAIVKDISARRAAEERLAHLASHDDLTGLANRAFLLAQTDRALDAADGDQHVAVLFCDLDQFKMVNDSIGHAAGDAMLIELAARLVATVPPGTVAARPGGDEFVFLLSGLPAGRAEAEEEARLVAARLLMAVAAPFLLHGRRAHTTMSIGIAISDGDGSTPAEMLRDADTAMYRAKASGRGCVDVFDNELRSQTIRRVQIEAELREAGPDELVVHFQPIVDLPSGDILGAEALLRWQHPTQGLLLPAAFLDVAEDAGLMVGIGRHVLEASARHLAGWRRATGRDLYVTVNVAAGQLGIGRLPSEVASLLAGYDLPPTAIRLEVTENTLLATDGLAALELASMVEADVPVGLDDFGTGYGSLTHLMSSGATFLKLDRQFVQAIEASPIAEAVIGLGSALGLDVIAEGIETAPQALILQNLGCRYGQGFLYSRAVPPDDFATLLG